MQRVFEYILIAIASALLVAVGVFIGHSLPKEPHIEPQNEKVDTLIIRDTITFDKPVYIDRIRTEKVYVAVSDTIRLRDTLYVPMDKEYIAWTDSLCTVYASGILPSVDSVRHYTQKEVITHTITNNIKVPSRMGLGIQVGLGAIDGSLKPYIGFGVTFNVISW